MTTKPLAGLHRSEMVGSYEDHDRFGGSRVAWECRQILLFLEFAGVAFTLVAFCPRQPRRNVRHSARQDDRDRGVLASVIGIGPLHPEGQRCANAE
jgi:hypothetical protein